MSNKILITIRSKDGKSVITTVPEEIRSISKGDKTLLCITLVNRDYPFYVDAEFEEVVRLWKTGLGIDETVSI